MSLNHHQQRQLHRIESRLLRSDPHLAAMLAVFVRLSADQLMPAWEQDVATRRDRIRQAALITKAIAALAATIGFLVSAVLALLTVISAGRRAQPPESAREQTDSETSGRPDPADWG
jgi:hypothetical protein